MKKLLLATLFAVFAATQAQSAEEPKHFFEPTQADYDCCNSAIMAQQSRYAVAKSNSDYEKALKEALFNWTTAWLHFNKAMDVAQGEGAWNNAATLTSALGYLDKAEASAKLAKGKEAKAVLAKVAKNRKWISERLEKISNE